MNSLQEDNEQMNWLKYGFAVIAFLFGTAISGACLTYYGDMRYGSGLENYPPRHLFLTALGLLAVGAPASKTTLTMSLYYSNTGYLRIITLHFLCGVFATAIMIILHLAFEILKSN